VSNFVDIVVLCEDRQQEVFVRYFLENCGIDPHRIRANICPKGKTAGEQYVREAYPKEVMAYRRVSSYKTIGLTVVTDADIKAIVDKFRELEEALAGRNQDKRQARERIALLIPKRNIETWIHYLQGEPVNEADSYPKLAREGDCKPAVKRLAQKPSYTPAAGTPSSLREACREIKRILPDKRCEELES